MAIMGSMFFSQKASGVSYGWSESFWLPTASSLPNGVQKMRALIDKRILLLGAGVSVDYCRVSDQRVIGQGGVQGDSQIFVPENIARPPQMLGVPVAISTRGSEFPVYNVGLVNEAGQVGKSSDVIAAHPFECALVRLEGVSNNYTIRRSYYLRGLPQYISNSFSKTADSVIGGTRWVAAWIDYEALLKGGDYGIVALDKSGANAENLITNWDFATTQPSVTLGPGVLAVGDKVRISKALHLVGGTVETKQLNGVWRVQSANAGVYKFVGMESPSGTVGTLQMGLARKQTYNVVAINKCIHRGFTKKSTGSPFDLKRGRRKTRS